VQAKPQERRFFSIELNSICDIKNIQINNGREKESILLEGTIGNLLQADFTEGIVLEVVGDKGTLRINLLREEIKDTVYRVLKQKLSRVIRMTKTQKTKGKPVYYT
jgi:hypothetical protein